MEHLGASPGSGDPALLPGRAPGTGVGGLQTDLYQLTMLYGYQHAGLADQRAAFELFFRRCPFGNGYVLAAGLERVLRFVQGLGFSERDLSYLESTGLFPDPGFLDLLARFRFTGDIDAVPEGTAVFPHEPLLQVRARLFEAQLLETAAVNMIGYASLIATKAARIARAAGGRTVLEFGARRAHELDAALEGARAAVIGGCAGTSFVAAGARHGLHLSGTHAHSWVLSFPGELEAFRAYGEAFSDNLIFLVDTYDVLRSGVPNAIRAFREVRARRGALGRHGIRIDSGDLADLSKRSRAMLDAAGFPDAIIVASNELDEAVISELQRQGARIDVYGVGTHLITAYDQPALGCVYKLVAIEQERGWAPRMKRSENAAKITNPGVKRVLRFRDRACGRPFLDWVSFSGEPVPIQPFRSPDPVHTWKRVMVSEAEHTDLLVPAMRGGDLVYDLPTTEHISARAQECLGSFDEQFTRLLNPADYAVHLSPTLRKTKWMLLQATGGRGRT